MKILKKYFASSWVLLHELKAGTNDSSMPADMKQKYRRILDTYSFPVECIISHDNGTVIHHENLNSILFPEDREKLDEEFEKDGLSHVKFGNLHNYRYAQFLTRGLEKASIAHDTQVTV